MARPIVMLFALAAFSIVGNAAGQPARPLSECFLVRDKGYALLGPDGKETERLESITNAAGAVSPDGTWVLYARSRPFYSPDDWQGQIVIQSRVHPGERITRPQTWGQTGSSFLPIWSGDSKRILICEQGQKRDGTRGSDFRIFDITTKREDGLKLPPEWWPCDWSSDGRRLLINTRVEDRAGVAWVNIDGTGEPEFITPEEVVTSAARLSPDNRRVLCKVRAKDPKDERDRGRLCVVDLTTKERTVVDEPGVSDGYCWSSDGARIAYTWQRSLEKPAETPVRETFLITCDPDGGNRKTVTSRRYEVPENSSGRDDIVYFFEVLSWWRNPE